MDESRVDAREAKRVEVKPLWTEKDLDNLFWHLCGIRGITFDATGFYETGGIISREGANQMLFDIDYTFKYLLARDGSCREPMISPCTLVFEDVTHLSFHYDKDCMQINPVIGGMKWWPNRDFPGLFDVHIDLFNGVTDSGVITFISSGFKMYVRKEPMAPIFSRLSTKQRGGICFDRITIDQPIVLEDPSVVEIKSNIKYY